jgi:hypothetical protein
MCKKEETWLETAIKSAVEAGILVDKRAEMPKGPGKWERRSLDDVVGLCIHQNGSENFTNPKETASYHTHVGCHIFKDERACPSIAYHIAIPDVAGPAWLVANLLDVTAAQGDADHPGYENKALVSVLVMGLYRGPGVVGHDAPSPRQLKNLNAVATWLEHVFHFGAEGIFGHYMFGKAGCPGYWGMQWIEAQRAEVTKRLSSPHAWQMALRRWKPEMFARFGVDGVWGAESKRALIAYQREHGLQITALPDEFTELHLMRTVKWTGDDETQAQEMSAQQRG